MAPRKRPKSDAVVPDSESDMEEEAQQAPKSGKCLEKKIFAALAEFNRETTLSLFTRYIEQSCDPNTAFGNIVTYLTPKLLAAYYNPPHQKPHFFTSLEYHDFARLERSFLHFSPDNLCLVILAKEVFKRRHRKHRFFTLFDGRQFKTIVNHDEGNRKPVFAVISFETRNLKEASVEVVCEKSPSYEELAHLDTTVYVDSVGKTETRQTASEAVMGVLGLEEEALSWVDLQSDRNLDTADYSVLCVCHRMTKRDREGRLMMKHDRNSFSHLGNWGKTTSKLKVILVKVVWTLKGREFRAYELDEKWSKIAAASNTKRKTYHATGDAWHDFHLGLVQKKRLHRLYKHVTSVNEAEKAADAFFCKCLRCRESFFKFPGDELPEKGPQRNMSVSITSSEFLKWFDMATPENKERMEKIFDLSVAALDLESTTKVEDDEGPDSSIPIDPISTIPSQSHRLGRQQFCLIGVGDGYDHEDPSGESGHYKQFELGKDARDSVHLCMKLIIYLRERRNHLFKRKMELAKPIMDNLWVLYRVYYNTCKKFFEENGSVLDDVIPPENDEDQSSADDNADADSEKTSEDEDSEPPYCPSTSADSVSSLSEESEQRSTGESSLSSASTTDVSEDYSSSSDDDDEKDLPEPPNKRRRESDNSETDSSSDVDMEDESEEEEEEEEDEEDCIKWESLRKYHAGRIRTKTERIHRASLMAANNSLVGLFLKHLYKKCLELHVFTFAGSRYDHVLLLSPLCIAARMVNVKGNVQPFLDGNKVRSIRIGREDIDLVDVQTMLPMGTSLKRFAASTSLSIRKGIFPFAMLKEGSKFLDSAFLPSDTASWFSELSQSGPTSAEIAEALKEFDENGDTCVRDFMTRYLTGDVKMTAIATMRLFRSHLKFSDLNPIDLSKFSCSSHSFSSTMLELYRKKAPAAYMLNIKSIFSAVKSSALGGITQVLRHQMVEGSPPLNDHLFQDGNKHGKKISYLDENRNDANCLNQSLNFIVSFNHAP